jgi:hypothetical protein
MKVVEDDFVLVFSSSLSWKYQLPAPSFISFDIVFAVVYNLVPLFSQSLIRIKGCQLELGCYRVSQDAARDQYNERM